MTDKEFDLDDPFQPVAIRLATPGYDGSEAMARCFVEEFALLGWPADRIFKLFASPAFAGSHSVYLDRGADYIRRLIADVLGCSEVPAERTGTNE